MSTANGGTANGGTANGSPARLETLWAALVIDPTDGTEGIAAFFSIEQRQWFPLVCGRESLLGQLGEQARAVQAALGVPLRLVRFTHREDMGGFTK